MAVEALDRAGRNPHLKGIVHEVLYRDRLNLNPRNLLTGTSAHLTGSGNAVQDDLILKQAGRVVGRAQLMDTADSIRKTVRQVSSGKYARTVLLGTWEIAAVYAEEVAGQVGRGVKVTQAMRSTGISSTDTARVASKALGQLPGRAVLIAGLRNAGSSGDDLTAAVELAGASVSCGTAGFRGASWRCGRPGKGLRKCPGPHLGLAASDGSEDGEEVWQRGCHPDCQRG